MNHIALLHEELLRLGAYRLYHRFGQELLVVESLDAFIQVHTC